MTAEGERGVLTQKGFLPGGNFRISSLVHESPPFGSAPAAIPEPEAIRWRQAHQQLASGRAAEAVRTYVSLTRRLSGVANLWFECGLAAAAELDFALAKRAFQQARDLAPKDVSLLLAVAQQYHRLRQPALARACFQQAADAEPDSAHARLSLAAWFERERDLDAAWQCLEVAQSRHPSEPSVLYYRAFLLHRRGDTVKAEEALRELVKTEVRDANIKVSSFHLLSVVLDELGQYGEALRWLGESKKLARTLANTAALEQAYDKADHARRQLLETLSPAMIRRWREETPPSAMPHPLALLGGHPRSGTTLLEQILGAHPDILAFDESEAFATEVWDRLAPAAAPPANAQALAALSPSRCSGLRARYYKSLFRELEGPPAAGQVLVDKNPAPTGALHLWLRLFPASRIIMALRDPRDVILSCYFQQLTLTPMNVNFLSFERAARHYSDLMDVWLRLRDLGGFDWLETRYEDFTREIEAEGRRVTEFLGLAWQERQARGHEAARRKVVFSPTYADVTKPVHRRAVGRWQHYGEALAPVQAAVARYCQTFGY